MSGGVQIGGACTRDSASTFDTARLYALDTAERGPNSLRSQDFHSSEARNCGLPARGGENEGAAGCARLPGVKVRSRSAQVATALFAVLAMLLAAAPAALADNGVGLAGPTTDKTVTFFCFGVIAFFAILVIAMSLIQGKLEKRKERRRHDLSRV
jgi:hypothetical protein